MKRPNFNSLLPLFQDRYTFEECSPSKIDEVVSFIDRFWKKDHAFVQSRKLLDWQFYNTLTNRYNIIVATHKQTGEIHAMVGVVSTRHFDPKIEMPVRWGNMWKTRPDVEPGLGMMVEWKKNALSPAVAEVGLGQSVTAIRLAKKTGAVVGVMEHFFLPDSQRQHFLIAKNIDTAVILPQVASNSLKALRTWSLSDYEQMSGEILNVIPSFKSKYYYKNRYYHHPFYHYHASAITDQGKVVGLLFWRLCTANNSRCVRIVDYFGFEGALSGCRDCLIQLLRQQNAEYIDFLCVGMSQEELQSGGFLDRRSNADWIIPNYFEPFVQENVDVTYSCMPFSEDFHCVIFKGDSDQDRPNLIGE